MIAWGVMYCTRVPYGWVGIFYGGLLLGFLVVAGDVGLVGGMISKGERRGVYA